MPSTVVGEAGTQREYLYQIGVAGVSGVGLQSRHPLQLSRAVLLRLQNGSVHGNCAAAAQHWPAGATVWGLEVQGLGFSQRQKQAYYKPQLY